MCFLVRRRFYSAFSTTLLQNTLSIILACSHHAIMIARLFECENMLFKQVYMRAANLTLGLSFLHVTGSAFNVSLLWLEIASCRQFQIVNNVTRTKQTLISVIALMYILYLSVAVVAQNSRLAMMIWCFFLLALICSCGIGAVRLARVLSKDLNRGFLDECDRRRNEAKRFEIKKVLATASRVCVFCAIGLLFNLIYIQTFDRRNPLLTHILYVCYVVSFLLLRYTVLWYLRGKVFLCWKISQEIDWVEKRKSQRRKIFVRKRPVSIGTAN